MLRCYYLELHRNAYGTGAWEEDKAPFLKTVTLWTVSRQTGSCVLFHLYLPKGSDLFQSSSSQDMAPLPWASCYACVIVAKQQVIYSWQISEKSHQLLWKLHIQIKIWPSTSCQSDLWSSTLIFPSVDHWIRNKNMNCKPNLLAKSLLFAALLTFGFGV